MCMFFILPLSHREGSHVWEMLLDMQYIYIAKTDKPSDTRSCLNLQAVKVLKYAH
jgi:hypothetical protein